MNTLIRTLVRQPFLRPAFILVALAFFAHIPAAQAVSPPPDGGYSGGNTAEGDSALSSLTSGTYNTGIGWFSLRSVTSNERNTAVGAGTLLLNAANDNTATGAGALLNNSTGAIKYSKWIVSALQ